MKKALFSVTDKTGLESFAKSLLQIFPKLEILASGGTAKLLENAGIPHRPIAEITQFPECFGGRIKTLHPKILGGILFQRGVDEDEAQKLCIEPIDLVVCNLYSFDSNKTGRLLAESMDIGGSTLIRAASKNCASVAIVADPNDYPLILNELASQGKLDCTTRYRLAAKAMRLSANYENLLADGFMKSHAACTQNEPRPKERGMIWEESRSPSKFGFELPGPEGPGFLLPDEPCCKKQGIAIRLEKERKLPYGENPDQEGWVYSLAGEDGIASAKTLGTKSLSYNNYEDASAAFLAVQRIVELLPKTRSCPTPERGGSCAPPLSDSSLDPALKDRRKAELPVHEVLPAAAIVKHGSLCGLATGNSLSGAFQTAWDGDSKSAFGSIVALSQEVTEELCEELKKRFIEVILAPSFTPAFLTWAFQAKPSLRLLQIRLDARSARAYRSISGGMLVQTPKQALLPSINQLLSPMDVSNAAKIGVATKRLPEKDQAGLLQFAIAAVQSVKSNAIVLVREYAPSCYQLIGVGGGQPNRIDSLQRLALPKAIENLRRETQQEEIREQLGKLVLASDGFFPFADSIQTAADAGIQLFVQPGGSMRDAEVIQEADRRGLCMIFTGQRYFSH